LGLAGAVMAWLEWFDKIGGLMYRCPRCGDLSISGATQFSPPFDGRTKCPTCGAELKVKHKSSNFILPLYLIGRSTLSLLFGIRFELDFVWDTLILVTLLFIQIRFIAYVEAKR
jgi:predicted RNA-binding Zn-ribbon protein involved in translation (DUF1610 family)